MNKIELIFASMLTMIAFIAVLRMCTANAEKKQMRKLKAIADQKLLEQEKYQKQLENAMEILKQQNNDI